MNQPNPSDPLPPTGLARRIPSSNLTPENREEILRRYSNRDTVDSPWSPLARRMLGKSPGAPRSPKQLTIPIPQYSLIADALTPGENVNWKIGDLAIWTASLTGQKIQVTIDSERVGSVFCPGKPCYEVIFPDGRFCVAAERLRLP